jgi:signal transduction histidine kinase
MKKLSDEELLEELRHRIDERNLAYAKLESINQELNTANKKLMESEKLKSNFLSNARNEIINPLSSILSLAQSIAYQEGTSLEEARKLAAFISKEAFDLDFQLKNIFASAEIEAGEAFCEYYRINLIDLLSSQISTFGQFAADREVKLKIEDKLFGTSSEIKSDPSKIQIILDNLLVNAINWSDKNSTVTISLSVENERHIIAIADQGPGIAPEDQKRIFDRFTTLKPGVHDIKQGHGLGLSIANAYAELIDGEIKLESTEGEGSVFYLMLNAAPGNDSEMLPPGDNDELLFSNGTTMF